MVGLEEKVWDRMMGNIVGGGKLRWMGGDGGVEKGSPMRIANSR